jgi:UDP-3-O-[3-hydroxymyristoyl] glucosamine N-acyltransferase
VGANAATPAVAFTLAAIQADLGGELVGDPAREVSRLAPLERAGPDSLSFLSNPRYASQLARSNAACVVVTPAHREAALARGAALVVADPYLYFARLTQWWARRTRPAVPGGVHPSAVVDPTAQLADGVSIGPLAVVEAHTVLGAGVVIGAQSFVGAHASIGRGTRLAPRVVVGSACQVGEDCLLHSGVVIGADGFGFAPRRGGDDGAAQGWEKIEQLGAVRIGNQVEIGANTCIDRGALEDTVLEDGVKLDNLIQIGHNVRIGRHTAMAGCAGVAGSAIIGAHCTVGGGAVVLGHLELADHVHISAATVVMRSIHRPGQYSGVFPIDDNAAWEKNAATLKQLHALRDRVRALEKKTP